ncbi:c6 zinc finger domain containing protein [Apiospora aurea]|uniref:C6 zinc finger domain containing protein n=1 Tax=Apiospora aurea TaxID=335848 RepID=A0ABR1PV94_9PEZI
MSDAVAAPTPTPTLSRIKRNSACTSCRDAKVRCNPSNQPSQQCQRCDKLGLECVDRTHKRVSRRNKIDELVQEIRTIKQTVGSSQNPTGGIVAAPFPRDPPLPQPVTNSPDAIRASTTDKSAPSGPSFTETPATTLVGDVPIEPSLPRALGSQPFSGEDIDYYFKMYFEHFHPYMPIVRHRDPNKCYESGPVLFWTILLVACRRYAKNPQVLPFLVDAMRRELFSVLSSLPTNMHTINAMILVCTWVFPDVRFGGFQGNFTDEEAHYTWAGYNIVTQRSSHYMDIPPLGSLFNQTVQTVIEGRTPFYVPSSFRVLLECQKFAHRLSKTMAACLEESEGVSSYIVQQLEDDYDNIRGLICSERADDMDKFNALLVQLEIQTYYLIPLPGYNPEALKRNILKAYTTSQAVLRDALSLDDQHGYLKHMPHFAFRSLLSAMCIIYKVSRSSYREILDQQGAERSAANCMEVCRRSVIQEGDLGARLTMLFESFWSVAQSTAVWHGEPTVTVGTQRMGAGVCFDCLKLWKSDMNTMRPKAAADGGGGGIGNNNNNSSSSSNGDAALGATAATGSAAALGTGIVTAPGGPDPLANIDWSFMDEFDWNFEPNLLVPVGLGP